MIRQLFILVVFIVASWTTASATSEKVLYTIDFSGQPDGPALQWLEQRGFELQLGAKNLNPHFQGNRLKLQSDGEDAGLFVKAIHLPNAKRIRIYWGVERYPQGANWENGVNAVSLAVMVSFGDKKMESGAFYIPDAPYFIVGSPRAQWWLLSSIWRKTSKTSSQKTVYPQSVASASKSIPKIPKEALPRF